MKHSALSKRKPVGLNIGTRIQRITDMGNSSIGYYIGTLIDHNESCTSPDIIKGEIISDSSAPIRTKVKRVRTIMIF